MIIRHKIITCFSLFALNSSDKHCRISSKLNHRAIIVFSADISWASYGCYLGDGSQDSAGRTEFASFHET